MGIPPRDQDGNVLPHDDPDIADQDGLLRYIDPENHLVWDDNTQSYRVSSGALSESSEPNGGMSVDLERLMLAAGLTSEHRLPGPRWGIARIFTGAARGLGLRVGSDPLPDNPHHGAVWGIGYNKSIKRKLLAGAQWIRHASRA